MNKKAYITPEMEIMNIETIEMMATSNVISVSNDTTTDDASMASSHRGSWGNLWNE